MTGLSFTPTPGVWIASAAAFAVLTAGSIAAWVLGRLFPRRNYTNLVQRIRTWWLIVPLLSGVLALGAEAVACLFAVIGMLALREYAALAGAGKWMQSAWLRVAVVVLPAAQFYLACVGPAAAFGWLIPLCAVACAAIGGRDRWSIPGGLLIVYGLSHVPRLAGQPDGMTWVAFLLVVTQVNDVAQYVWGRSLGRTPLVPRLSPNKTRGGFYGGVATAAMLAVWLGPAFLQVDWMRAGLSGIILSLLGTAGDLTVSALKRRAGVKDAGTLLPGHGGVLDRVDSLLYTAPALFYLVHAGIV